MKGIEFYTIDSKLLSQYVKCVKSNQKQAKTYYKSFQDISNLDVKIKNKKVIKDIFNIIGNLQHDDKEIIIVIHKSESEQYGVTVYYSIDGTATHKTISYLYCPIESNYNLANKIVNYLKNIDKVERV